MQGDAFRRQFLFDCTRHVCPRLLNLAPNRPDRAGFVSRIVPAHASQGQEKGQAKDKRRAGQRWAALKREFAWKSSDVGWKLATLREAAPVATQ
jgi:hypothetical protein